MMHNLQTLIENYLEYCGAQKRLDEKTLKAYRIDLKQFSEWTSVPDITKITSETLENHIWNLPTKHFPKFRYGFVSLSYFPRHYRCILLKHF